MLSFRFTVLLLALTLAFVSSLYGMDAGEELALHRLSNTVDVLTSYEDELVGEPISGMLLMEDTVSIDFDLEFCYLYEVVVWTESSFNFVDFWVTSPTGSVPVSEQTDHVSLPIVPNSTDASWNLQIELLEAAESDTAYYAFALLRRPR